MAVLRKTDPTGLDLRIDQFQDYQFKRLGFTDEQYISYPRVYLNEVEIKGKRGLLPEYFESVDDDYDDVRFNDNYALSSFFYRMPKSAHDEQTGTVRVVQIFQAQLDKLFPTAPHRFDEELNGMLENVAIKFYGHDQFQLVETIITIDEVYRDLLTDHIKYDDMHPFYVVRIEYLVRYNPNEKC